MLREAILHESGGAYAYPVSEDTLLIQLRTAKDGMTKVYVFYGDRYTWPEVLQHTSMEKYASDQLFDYYRIQIQVTTRKFRYLFLLDDGKERIWYNEFGFHSSQPSGYYSGYFQYPYIAPDDYFAVPDWVQDAVVYEIFPERFCNGNLANDPEKVKSWGELPQDQMDFYGGDLAGIIEKLPYIEDLGVNTIYLTPIFHAATSHKYDTTDYFLIDPHFGNNELFRNLVQECHARGIRVVLDAVFNHCGYDFPQFQDVLARGTESSYVDWFYIHDFPVTSEPITYEAFAEVAWRLPKLNLSNSEVREYLLQVAEYWVREYDIDGWRLDVANEIPQTFWREFRQRVRAIKDDLYIIGETWHHSGTYLQGDQFDAVMNYPFREAVIYFFGKRTLSVDAFDERLTWNRVTYRQQAVQAAWNLLDSHDTDRMLTCFAGNKAAFRLAIMFQMTYLGIPFVYYGDEIGLEGDQDPDCRRCMPWDEKDWDQDLLQYYRKLIKVYRESSVLRRGEYQTIYKDEATRIFAYKRFTETEQVVVVLNNSIDDQKMIIELTEYGFAPESPVAELISGQEFKTEAGVLTIDIGQMEGVILTQVE